MPTADKLVTVYKACGQLEAEIVKGRLQIEEIPAYLKYESLGAIYGLTIDGLGQVEVQVLESCAEKAKEILDTFRNTDNGHPLANEPE